MSTPKISNDKLKRSLLGQLSAFPSDRVYLEVKETKPLSDEQLNNSLLGTLSAYPSEDVYVRE